MLIYLPSVYIISDYFIRIYKLNHEPGGIYNELTKISLETKAQSLWFSSKLAKNKHKDNLTGYPGIHGNSFHLGDMAISGRILADYLERT